ncbi:MAG: hypothetical protein DRJ42_09805 [Deltaproteobacteria bacterium]|nr:MAG: hypothetical protein DRJ42_09805 [Deltaproteobacteria bacterium]
MNRGGLAVALLASLLLLLLAACSDDDGGTDGGIRDAATDGGSDGGVLVAPPDIPWLDVGVPPIMLAPCPDGWREVAGGSVTECDPYPEGGPATCGLGEAHFPGEPECRPIGDACPAGDYATTLPTDGTVIYVNAAAAAGGDGSVETPYASISNVTWTSLGAGTTVALAKGSYEGVLPLKAGVQVVGACVRDTILTGLAAPVPSVVSVTGAGEAAVLRNLAITNPPQTAAQVERGRSLSLEGVLIDRSYDLGITAWGAGSTLTLTDTVVRDTRFDGTSTGIGRGVLVEDGAQLHATRLVVTGSRYTGVFVGQEGTAATLTDAFVGGTRRDGFSGLGSVEVIVEGGARFEAAHLMVLGNPAIAMIARDDGTQVFLSDAVLRDTDAPEGDVGEIGGLTVRDGAILTAIRLLIAEMPAQGIFSTGDGTEVSLQDVVVRDSNPRASRNVHGRGVAIGFGAHLEANNLLVTSNRDVGILGAGGGAVLTLTNVAVQTTDYDVAQDTGGMGIGIQEGARFEGVMLLVTGNRDVGIYGAGPGSALSVSDAVVRDMRPRQSDGTQGHGLHIEGGAHFDGRRIHIDQTLLVGVAAVSGADVQMEDLTVTNIEPMACASSTCPDFAGIAYAAVAVSGTLRLTRFELRSATACGVMLHSVAAWMNPVSLDLQSGAISEMAIGACVQEDGYDLGRLSHDVAYYDNGTNLDSTMLPVPSPLNPVAP